MAGDVLGRAHAGLPDDPSSAAPRALTDLVVDASAAVHLASLAAAPRSLTAYRCVAPPLMWSEALSALQEAAFRGAIPVGDLDAVVTRLERLPVEARGGDAPHRRRAIGVARSLGWAKTYDAEYVALAEALDAPLLTVDRRLIRGVGDRIRIVTPAQL